MAHTTQPAPSPAAGDSGTPTDVSPWPALFALCLGFFMILVDSTIVSVATPAIIADLQADVNDVVWVTSAYLLAYAVPVLITGRLGDRFGPKNLYMLGLTVFTLSSLWCGLTGSIEGLIVARVFQGLGAAMITPQTMAIITRIFPSERRGQAMALWGATAGVATLVGPILGGVLVDALGWEWIFFINIPVGVIGLVLAWRLVPEARHQQPPLRLARGDAVGGCHVPAGLRDPGGPPVRLGHHHGSDLGPTVDHQRDRGLRAVRPLAGPQQGRATGAAVAVPGPQLQPRQRRDLLDGVRDHRDGVPDHALRAAGARPLADRVGPAAGPDGADVDPAGADRRQAHRHDPPTADHRRRLRRRERFAGLAEPGDDPRLRHLGDPAADGAAGHRQRRRLGAHLGDRHPQPADAPGRSRRRGLQREPPGRCRARLSSDRGADGLPAGGPGAELLTERGWRWEPARAGVGTVQRGDVPGDAAAGRHPARRLRGRPVLCAGPSHMASGVVSRGTDAGRLPARAARTRP